MLATAFSHQPAVTTASHEAPQGRTVGGDILARRLGAGQLRIFEAKEYIFREGDPVTNVYLVEVGHICIYRTLADGRRQVIDFAYPGDIVGLGAMGEHGNNAQATARTRVRCMPTASLQQAIREDGRLGLKLCEALSRELIASRELLFTVSQRTAGERVATFLMGLSRRNERIGADPHEFVLPMTRADIADFLGLTIETVSRTFTRLRGDGLIDLAQSVLVTIVDYDGLKALADGRND